MAQFTSWISSLFADHSSTTPAHQITNRAARVEALEPRWLLAGDVAAIDTPDAAANQAPTIEAVADQQINGSQGVLNVSLGIADADNDSVVLQASAYQLEATSALAHELDAKYGFELPRDAGLRRHRGPRGFEGADGKRFFILESGQLFAAGRSIADSTLIATLDSSYYHDLSKICQATAPQRVNIDVAIRFEGNTIVVDPMDNFVGSFEVSVTASDGKSTSEQTFTVTVANHGPTVSAIGDQQIAAGSSGQVSVSGQDVDGDTLTYTATAFQVDEAAAMAFQLDQQHGFRSGASTADNHLGQNERYFVDAQNNEFFILANGDVFRLAGSSVAESQLVARLNGSYHQDLSKLLDAKAPATSSVEVGLRFDGGQLTLDVPAGLRGTFRVTVTASDGLAQASQTFSVTVTESAAVSVSENSSAAAAGTSTATASELNPLAVDAVLVEA